MSSAKLGHPVAIRDEDIDCPYPSFNGLSLEQQAEFADPIQQIINIQLTQISGTILNQLYSIPAAKQERDFVKDVHNILSKLRTLDAGLPAHLKLDPSRTPPFKTRNVASLSLHLYQVSSLWKITIARYTTIHVVVLVLTFSFAVYYPHHATNPAARLQAVCPTCKC
jgi:hypothetical protein